MNIKFSDQSVRCRVTRDELDVLLLGRAVVLDVPLPRDHKFRLNVRPAATGLWQLDSDPTGLWLTIPRDDIASLSETLPSKQGITHEFPLSNRSSVAVTFEVDVRQKRIAP